MWFSRLKYFLSGPIRRHRVEKYVARLKYTAKVLKDTDQLGMLECKREYTLNIVRWLYYYYTEPSEYSVSPEDKLTELLSVPAGKMTEREHIYSRVLHSWIKNKQIEGF